ncbi:MAG TPA: TniQ family protein [Blastocatellia bacterium]|nr:TniQ family protein [Blastocatellia bacterium]
MTTALSLYECWDLQPAVVPPRSRLIPLAPQGSGTGLGESFTSYLTRLAAAHCLHVTVCYSLLLYPALRAAEASPSDTGVRPVTTHGAHGITHRAHTWNSVSPIAAWHVKVTEQLTGARDLRLLTWLPYAALLTHHLRHQRAWCPSCFADWRAAGQPLYEPLLWTLQAVRYCPHHQCPLVTNCPTCQQSSAVLGLWAQAGYCFRCRHWLGAAAGNADVTSPAVTEAVQIAQSLATLIAQAGTLTVAPTRALVTQNLRTLIELLGGSCQAIARVLGFGHTVVVSWRDGHYLPRLETLARICLRLDWPLADFLTQPLPPTLEAAVWRETFFPAPLPRTVPPRAARPHHDLPSAPCPLPPRRAEQALHDLLTQELASAQPRPLRALAHVAGYRSLNPLYQKFPDLVQALVAKRRAVITGRPPRDPQWRAQSQAVLTAALAEIPLPTMPVLAARLGRGNAEELYRLFPAQCDALRAERTRRAAVAQQTRAAQLQAALQEETPRPLRQVAASLKVSLSVLYARHPDLACALAARATAHRQAQRQQARHVWQERLRQLAAELRAQGLPPTEENLAARAPELNRARLRRVWQASTDAEADA